MDIFWSNTILVHVVSQLVPEHTAHMPAVTDVETKQRLSVLVQVVDLCL